MCYEYKNNFILMKTRYYRLCINIYIYVYLDFIVRFYYSKTNYIN